MSNYRKIMEKAIGRKLHPWEHVHHKDHDRSHNELDNLEHCPTPQDHAREHAWTEDQLIDWLIQYSDEFGRLPRSKDVNEHPGMPHSSTYARRFGSWKAALRAAESRIQLLNAEHGGYDYRLEIEEDWSRILEKDE